MNFFNVRSQERKEISHISLLIYLFYYGSLFSIRNSCISILFDFINMYLLMLLALFFIIKLNTIKD